MFLNEIFNESETLLTQRNVLSIDVSPYELSNLMKEFRAQDPTYNDIGDSAMVTFYTPEERKEFENFLKSKKVQYNTVGEIHETRISVFEATKDELIAKINQKRQEKFINKVLSLMNQMVQQDPGKQSLKGAAFEISKYINLDEIGLDIKNVVELYKKRYRVNESVDGGKILELFRQMHHDTGTNAEMENWIEEHEWNTGSVNPEKIIDIDELFDYDDPFGRVIDINEPHVKKYISAIQNGKTLNPIILGPKYKNGKYSIIDGNHRALAYAALEMKVPAYVPVSKINENFADGKVKGKSRPGRAKRAGVDCSKSVSALRKQAKNSSGEEQKMAHWCANMKSGKKKK